MNRAEKEVVEVGARRFPHRATTRLGSLLSARLKSFV